MIHSFFELTVSLFVSFTCFIKFVKLYFDPQMHYLDPTTWCGICSRFFPISKSRAPLANFSNRSLYDEQMNPLLSRDLSYLSRIRSNAFVSWTRADNRRDKFKGFRFISGKTWRAWPNRRGCSLITYRGRFLAEIGGNCEAFVCKFIDSVRLPLTRSLQPEFILLCVNSGIFPSQTL